MDPSCVCHTLGLMMPHRLSATGTACDLCKSAECDVIGEVRDLHLYTPGVHRLMRCRQCGLIRLDFADAHPETDLDIAPTDYAPHQTMESSDRKTISIRHQLKAAALAVRRGYPASSLPPFYRMAGRLLAPVLATRLAYR